MTWRDRAPCLKEDPELFFPVGNIGPAPLQIEKVRLVCQPSEVAQTCLSWAAESRQQDGVRGEWASDDERRGLKRCAGRARRADSVAPGH